MDKMDKSVWERIASKYQKIIEMSEPYILTFPGNLGWMNLAPWGLEIPQKNIISCLDAEKAVFFDSLQSLDKHSFGPVGMPMEKWVFFDCGEMVGAIVGLGLKATQIDESLLKKFYNLDHTYQDIVPISMYISIPMASGAWFGHNLCSANAFLGEEYNLSGLALLTKVLGLKVMNIGDSFGATQWTSGALNIHLQLADMEVRSARTPAHSFVHTMTYFSAYTDEKMLKALSGQKREATSWDMLPCGEDEEFFIKLQERIQSGEKFVATGRPIYKNNQLHIPISKN